MPVDEDIRRLSRTLLRAGQSPFVALVGTASPEAEKRTLDKVTLVRQTAFGYIRTNFYALPVALIADIIDVPFVSYIYDLERRRALPLGLLMANACELEVGWTETSLSPSHVPLGKLHGK